MKTKLTETKFKSALGVAGHLFSMVACLGAAILSCSSASAQNLFVSDGTGGNIYEFTPNAVRSTFASGLNDPQGLAFDSAGNLFVADSGSGNVYKFNPLGVQSTFASGLNGPVGLACDIAGNVFVTDSLGVVGPGHGHVYKFTPGGVRSTLASGFISPEGLAFDSAGNLFLVDGGDIDGLGAAIYKFTPTGHQHTFVSAKTFCIGPGLAIDVMGNLFVPDWCFGNIYKITSNGRRSTFASGVGGADLAFDSAGNLFVDDGTIYKFTPDGMRTTFASGFGGFLAFGPPSVP
jgi:sugar lactone lactonase YvrE